jgi:hypothetical protein
MSCVSTNPPDCPINPQCPSKDGCFPGICPDFQIKRNDTVPPFRVSVEDENGPINLTNLVLEASMWANAKLKKDITSLSTSIGFAGEIGFEQVLENDIIVVGSDGRSPEHMLVVGFDEVNKLIQVERGFNNTTVREWKKGTLLKSFRFINAPATTEMTFEDIGQIDGTTLCNQLSESFLIYEWSSRDTCAIGCFYFEFKLIKMLDHIPSVIPSFIPPCTSGFGVEWVRRFPVCGEFIIKVCQSPTAEF